MKKVYLLIILMLHNFIYSQTNGISYQVIIRDQTQNTPLTNQNVCLQFKILNYNLLLDYQETINTITDENGLINTIIGTGTPVGGIYTNFNSIVWDTTSKSLVVEVDLSGTCNSFIQISNKPLTSVPYALYSKNGGITNLSYTSSPTVGTINSDTGSPAIIPLATDVNSGLLGPADFTKLSSLSADLEAKQDALIDSITVKTINGKSILGSGNLEINTTLNDTIINDRLDLKIDKSSFQLAENRPVNLAKIIPFTSGAEPLGFDFNSWPNKGGGDGTFNHAMHLGFNSGWHSGTTTTIGKPSIMIGLEDNYFDNDYDKSFGTEFYVQGFSPDGKTVSMSRPFYARGQQKDDGTNSWLIFQDIGSSGPHRKWRVGAGVDRPILQLTPGLSTNYTNMKLYNSDPNSFKYFNFDGNRSNLGSLGEINWTNHQWNSNVTAAIYAKTDTSINNASLNFKTSNNDEAAIDRMVIKSNGRILMNTNFDDLTNQLQVNGTISASPAISSNQVVVKSQLDTKYSGKPNSIVKFVNTYTLGEGIITDNGSVVDIKGQGSSKIDTRLSVSSTGNGGNGRGTAILLNVPGSSNSVNGVKINAYTVGGAVLSQSADLAFDLASSGILNEKMRITSKGNLLIGNTVDDGENKLQVNGSVEASQFKVSSLN
jgi:hypothetical protein